MPKNLPMSVNKIAIIGLGNTLRKDDGIGIIVLEALIKSHNQPGMDYLNFGIAGFDLIHRLEGYAAVLLIDGIDAGLKAGELKISGIEKLDYDLKDTVSSTHEFNLKNLFELCKKFNLKTKIYLAGIQVKDVSYGEGLSPELKARLDQILQEISCFINKIFPRPW